MKTPSVEYRHLGAVPNTGISLLLIEDNLEFRSALSAILELEGGLVVRCATSRAEGLKELSVSDADLILLDLELPDSGGLATLTAIQQGAPGVPVVVLTGDDDEEMAMEAVRRGAQDYLVKTEIRTRSLLRGLRYALERHALQAEVGRHLAEIERRNAQMESELKLARDIQQSYLPRQRMTFPESATPATATLRFSFRYAPADIIGGDFFSVQKISETEVGVFICDVMGHGVSAALVSATVRGLVEEMKAVAAEPGRFLGEMNRAIHALLGTGETRLFVTAFYMVVDIRRGELRYANAGHPTPFCIRAAGRRVRSLPIRRGGAALGLFGHTQYPVSKRSLRAGDLVMLFTDGLYEIESALAEPYGRERLPNDIRKRKRLTPARLFDDLIAHILDFSLTRRFDDDVCLVGMEVGSLNGG